jgi:inosine-uridine nucleoside N-ribohydrolase
MAGSVRVGYDAESGILAEWNVRIDLQAAQKSFEADWKYGFVLTPLDSCATVKLEGTNYQTLLQFASSDILIQALFENYGMWAHEKARDLDPSKEKMNSAQMIQTMLDEMKETSILFDTVAIYLALTEEHLIMEELYLRVDEEGFTVIDSERGKQIRVASGWKDQNAFHQFLMDRLKATLPEK